MSDIVEQISTRIRPKIDALKNLWYQIGYRPGVIDDRKTEVLHFFVKLAEDMLKEENECKEEILEDIEESKAEVEKLRQELGLSSEKSVDENQCLMAIWDSYQEICSRLKVLRQERVDKMKTLYDIEYPLCCRLGESPTSLIRDDETPQDKQFVEVEKNISRLRHLLEERSLSLINHRNAISELLSDLETSVTSSLESPSEEFQKSVISDESVNKFVLSEINMQKLSNWHLEVSKTHSTKMQEVSILREQIFSVGRRLNIPESDLTKKALYSKLLLTKCSSRIVDELTLTLSALNAEKLRKLPLVIEKTRNELLDAIHRCWLGDLEKQKYSELLTSQECTDEILDEIDNAVSFLKKVRLDNEPIFAAADCWVELMTKQQSLDEKPADPNRYKNRGGALLQEERARKEVAIALPKRERELYSLVADYFSRKGKPFFLMGLTAEEFVEMKKIEYEDEKMRKREMLKVSQVCGTSTLHSTSKTPGPRRAPPSASRLMTPVGSSSIRSNLRSASKMGISTPNLSNIRNTPLTASSRYLNTMQSSDEDVTLGLKTLPKTNRKRTSGQFAVSNCNTQQSPAKKRCIDTASTENAPLAPIASAPKSTRKPAPVGSTASVRNAHRNLISPAPRVFASPLGASSPSLPNLQAIPSDSSTRKGNRPVLGTKAKLESKAVSQTNLKTRKRISGSSRNLRNAPSTKTVNEKKPAARQRQQQHKQEGYPFSGPTEVDGGSVIDFNKLPDSFIVGNEGSQMLFHNASLDPDSGVLAGHSDATITELAVDSILVAPSVPAKPVTQQPAATRFAMPPPMLSSTMIVHCTRSQSANQRK